MRIVFAAALGACSLLLATPASAQSADWQQCQGESVSSDASAKADACTRILGDSSQSRRNQAIALSWRAFHLWTRANAITIPRDNGAPRTNALQSRIRDLTQAEADITRARGLDGSVGLPRTTLLIDVGRDKQAAERAMAPDAARAEEYNRRFPECVAGGPDTFDRKLASCEWVIANWPDNARRTQAAYAIAQAYYMPVFNRNDIPRARAAVARTLDIDPNHNSALTLGARLEYDQHNYAAAITYIERALAADGSIESVPWMADLIAASRLQTGAAKNDAIIAALETTIPDQNVRWSRWANTYNSRCWSNVVRGANMTLAQHDCDRAVFHSNSRDSNSLDSRGLVHLKLGNNDAARRDYAAAVALNNNGASYHYGLSVAARRLGDTALADRERAAAIALDANIAQTYAGYGITQ